MKTYLVVNPKSANGDTGKRWAEIQARVARALPSISHGFTEGPMHAEHLARAALHQGFDSIVAVGGDGTINETLNGFFEGGRPINPQASLGVLPRGTGGDFRRTFGWELDLDAAVERLKGEGGQPFDVGLLEYTAPDGSKGQRYFANIASFGVSGAVDNEVNQSSKALGGKLSFMLGSFKAMMKYADKKVRFRLDGGPWEEATVTTLAVANGKYFGGGMKVAPEALTHDGIFDITVWSGYSLKDFVLKQSGIYSGAHVGWKNTRCLKARVFEAESDEEVLIDCDGEQPGRLPCKMTLLPGAVKLKV
ncbi:MAG: diacylglycerol kinase family lipid kinase [Archangiaceae bacterium]|nr:diacylglycerol kinase family lipid kinase [Archangiaceae bacterium]